MSWKRHNNTQTFKRAVNQGWGRCPLAGSEVDAPHAHRHTPPSIRLAHRKYSCVRDTNTRKHGSTTLTYIFHAH